LKSLSFDDNSFPSFSSSPWKLGEERKRNCTLTTKNKNLKKLKKLNKYTRNEKLEQHNQRKGGPRRTMRKRKHEPAA
jgi:hypothetical protein